jgi:3-dehydroquinate synthetase
MDAMASDKKRRAGEARLVVPHALGDVRVHAGVPPERVREAWAAVGAA